MKAPAFRSTILAGILAAAILFPTTEPLLRAQPFWPGAPPPPMAVPTTPSAQRNAMNAVRTQVGWLQNAARTAPNYSTGGADNVFQQFQALQGAYTAFTATLNPQQAANGANELAELAAGLSILQEAFANYRDDLAGGRNARAALSDMCQVLNQAAAVWLQEFNKDCSRLRAGW